MSALQRAAGALSGADGVRRVPAIGNSPSASPAIAPAAPAVSGALHLHRDNPSTLLEAVFRDVEEQRMTDLPFLNPRLRVEAVDFADWQGHWLGVLITPWAMNLLLLPASEQGWPRLTQGAIRRVAFAAGNYDFVASVDARLGELHTCSLFSPVLEFADQDSARQTARAARIALTTLDDLAAVDTHAAGEISAPLSRRDFLRRAWR
nr:[NiFe]-hydrogenase assembly chaperone HybE [Rhodocyclus tenuis]